MAGQALYLKYRPQRFEEVVGQEAITRTLRNALRQGKIRHAYLLTGPRGTGKTTTARLLAKAVNCEAPEAERPCNACPICVAVNEGRLLDLIEIDAASNRGIDEIRELREKVGFRPNVGRFRVYVLDEAHMLTNPAFNALLKTLEEPPPHVIFALVTTDPHEIPATIISRCQRFDFRRIPLQAITDRLAFIAAQEGVTLEPAALELVARQSTGAMRDAISLLDQLTSYGDQITLDQVQMVLGMRAGEAAAQLAACIADRDTAGGLEWIDRAVGDGVEPRQMAREVVEVLRGLLLIQEGAGTRLLHSTAEHAAAMEATAGRMPLTRLLRAIRLFNEAATDRKVGLETIPQLPLELALVESILEPGAPATAELLPILAQPAANVAAPATSHLAETTMLFQASRVEPRAEPTVTVDASPEPPAAGEQLTLAQVQASWDAVLLAVRQRNPATQAVLNTGCLPVEVNGSEVVISFPFPFLRGKLGDPQRKMEIQEALGEVLNAHCHIKLVLADEFTPQKPTVAPAAAPAAEAGVAPAKPEPTALDEISRWAKERGGQITLVS